MGFFCHQSWEIALWWVGGPVKCHTAKRSLQFAKTPEWSNTWLWNNAYSLPRGNAIDKAFWYQQRNHDWCKKKFSKIVYMMMKMINCFCGMVAQQFNPSLLAFFPAGTLFRDLHHLKSLMHHKQDLNPRRAWV